MATPVYGVLNLLTHEKQALAVFIERDRDIQLQIIAAARKNPQNSAHLILAYQLIIDNIK